jgi:hypothetical protein
MWIRNDNEPLSWVDRWGVRMGATSYNRRRTQLQQQHCLSWFWKSAEGGRTRAAFSEPSTSNCTADGTQTSRWHSYFPATKYKRYYLKQKPQNKATDSFLRCSTTGHSCCNLLCFTSDKKVNLFFFRNRPENKWILDSVTYKYTLQGLMSGLTWKKETKLCFRHVTKKITYFPLHRLLVYLSHDISELRWPLQIHTLVASQPWYGEGGDSE